MISFDRLTARPTPGLYVNGTRYNSTAEAIREGVTVPEDGLAATRVKENALGPLQRVVRITASSLGAAAAWMATAITATTAAAAGALTMILPAIDQSSQLGAAPALLVFALAGVTAMGTGIAALGLAHDATNQLDAINHGELVHTANGRVRFDGGFTQSTAERFAENYHRWVR